MTSLKTVLAPFLIPHQVNATKAITYNTSESRTHRHLTHDSEFDMNFRITSVSHKDGLTGSVSVKANLPGRLTPCFAVFLEVEGLQNLIDSLVDARDLAFPKGSRKPRYLPGG